MKINFTNKQMSYLLQMVELGNWMINSYRLPDEMLEEYDDISQYVMENARKMNFNDITYNKKHDMYYMTREAEERLDPFKKSYDTDNFWLELVSNLAKRDYWNREDTQDDNHEDRIKKIFGIEEKYEIEFEENGLENVRVLDD